MGCGQAVRMRSLPLPALLLGLGGLTPFVAISVLAGMAGPEWQGKAMLALAAYAAVILAFLGGVHWGFALMSTAPDGVQRARFGLGVVPSLVGWAGLLVVFAGLETAGIAIEAAGFVALTIVEGRAAGRGLVPPAYMAMRYVLSAVVAICLVSVCLLRVFGTRLG